MTSLAEAFGLGRGCFGREGVLRCTGTFPDSYRLGVDGIAVQLDLGEEFGLPIGPVKRLGDRGFPVVGEGEGADQLAATHQHPGHVTEGGGQADLARLSGMTLSAVLLALQPFAVKADNSPEDTPLPGERQEILAELEAFSSDLESRLIR